MYAQTKRVTLNGFIQVRKGLTIPYRLELTDSLGYISGNSVTYKEPDEARAVISGMLDKKSKKLVFKETELLYSKGFHPEAFMCMVNARLQYTAGGRGLNGPLTSAEADNTKCATGTIIFSNENELKILFAAVLPAIDTAKATNAPPAEKEQEVPPTEERVNEYDMVVTMKKKVKKDTAAVKKQAEPAATAPAVTDKITAGLGKTYEWTTDTVVIDVWDGGNIDGDRISLVLNGKPVLSNYYLIKERRQLRLPLAAGMNTLTIQADNEGADAPNTASLLLTDGMKQYSILAYNPKGNSSVVTIKRGR
ncbi:MAG: hypothetical protein V4649_01145 [Bacteroidota bacterium]